MITTDNTNQDFGPNRRSPPFKICLDKLARCNEISGTAAELTFNALLDAVRGLKATPASIRLELLIETPTELGYLPPPTPSVEKQVDLDDRKALVDIDQRINYHPNSTLPSCQQPRHPARRRKVSWARQGLGLCKRCVRIGL